MMIRIESMYISPVKSLGLAQLERAYLDKPGIAGDRAFFIIDAEGKVFTQRNHGPLVQVRTAYDSGNGRLQLSFPDGGTVAGVPELGGPTEGEFYGRTMAGRVLGGEWGEALSAFAGRELRLVKANAAGSSFDAFPLSMCSTASLQALARAAGTDAIDGRRFRQNIYVEGATSHQEDVWIGGEVRVGAALLRVKMADPRCVVTTLSPETGEGDMDTLRVIASYRTGQPKEVQFGVYCTVVEPGEAAVGDEVAPVA